MDPKDYLKQRLEGLSEEQRRRLRNLSPEKKEAFKQKLLSTMPSSSTSETSDVNLDAITNEREASLPSQVAGGFLQSTVDPRNSNPLSALANFSGLSRNIRGLGEYFSSDVEELKPEYNKQVITNEGRAKVKNYLSPKDELKRIASVEESENVKFAKDADGQPLKVDGRYVIKTADGQIGTEDPSTTIPERPDLFSDFQNEAFTTALEEIMGVTSGATLGAKTGGVGAIPGYVGGSALGRLTAKQILALLTDSDVADLDPVGDMVEGGGGALLGEGISRGLKKLIPLTKLDQSFLNRKAKNLVKDAKTAAKTYPGSYITSEPRALERLLREGPQVSAKKEMVTGYGKKAAAQDLSDMGVVVGLDNVRNNEVAPRLVRIFNEQAGELSNDPVLKKWIKEGITEPKDLNDISKLVLGKERERGLFSVVVSPIEKKLDDVAKQSPIRLSELDNAINQGIRTNSNGLTAFKADDILAPHRKKIDELRETFIKEARKDFPEYAAKEKTLAKNLSKLESYKKRTKLDDVSSAAKDRLEKEIATLRAELADPPILYSKFNKERIFTQKDNLDGNAPEKLKKLYRDYDLLADKFSKEVEDRFLDKAASEGLEKEVGDLRAMKRVYRPFAQYDVNIAASEDVARGLDAPAEPDTFIDDAKEIASGIFPTMRRLNKLSQTSSPTKQTLSARDAVSYTNQANLFGNVERGLNSNQRIVDAFDGRGMLGKFPMQPSYQLIDRTTKSLKENKGPLTSWLQNVVRASGGAMMPEVEKAIDVLTNGTNEEIRATWGPLLAALHKEAKGVFADSDLPSRIDNKVSAQDIPKVESRIESSGASLTRKAEAISQLRKDGTVIPLE